MLGVRYRIVYFTPDPFLEDWHLPFGAVFKDEIGTGWTAVEAAIQPRFRPEEQKLQAVFMLIRDRFIRDALGVRDAGPMVHMGKERRLPPNVNPTQFLRDHMLPGRKERPSADGR